MGGLVAVVAPFASRRCPLRALSVMLQPQAPVPVGEAADACGRALVCGEGARAELEHAGFMDGAFGKRVGL